MVGLVPGVGDGPHALGVSDVDALARAQAIHEEVEGPHAATGGLEGGVSGLVAHLGIHEREEGLAGRRDLAMADGSPFAVEQDPGDHLLVDVQAQRPGVDLSDGIGKTLHGLAPSFR